MLARSVLLRRRAMSSLAHVAPVAGHDAVQVSWTDGASAKFHHIWLRDHCSCDQCMHPTTKQRQVHTATIPLDAPATAMTVHGDTLKIDWKDPISGSACKQSAFSSDWLRKYAYSGPKTGYPVNYSQDRLDKKVLWGKELSSDMPTTTYDDMMADGFRSGMQLLQQHGLLLIKRTPDTMEATEAFARKIGFVLETVYGTMWTTRPKTEEMSYNDTASTNLELPPHTDCTYLYSPPGLQIFNCVQQAAGSPGDGASRYVDGFHVAEWLRTHAPDAFEFFSTTKLPSYCLDDDTSLAAMEPVIQLDIQGHVQAFRLNDGDRAVLAHLSFEDTIAFYRHHKQLWRAINELELVHKLNEGDMMVVDNQRVLHGRHAFLGERALIGCYIGKTEYDSRLRVLGLL